jgi:hypothetical protein
MSSEYSRIIVDWPKLGIDTVLEAPLIRFVYFGRNIVDLTTRRLIWNGSIIILLKQRKAKSSSHVFCNMSTSELSADSTNVIIRAVDCASGKRLEHFGRYSILFW